MPFPRLPARLSTLTAAAMLLTGSGCRDRQESAHEGVREASFAFTVSDFVKSAGEGRLPVTRSFLDAGMNPNVAAPDGRTALMAAAAGGRGEIVELLLAKGARATAKGAASSSSSPLSPVPAAGSGADSPPRSPENLTPLLAAVRGGDERSVSALLKAGASPAAEGPPDQVPITAAALLGHAAIVEVLAPLCRDSLNSALLLACGKGHTAVMDVLLNAGADINSADAQNRTPLMLAAMADELAAVRLLCHRQADLAKKDHEGHTAAELAASTGHPQPAAFLNEWAQRQEGSPGSGQGVVLAAASGAAFPAADADPQVPADGESPMPASPGEASPAVASSSQSATSTGSPAAVPAGATAKAAFNPATPAADSGSYGAAGPAEEPQPPEMRSIANARFPRLHCDAVNDVPGVLAMVSWQLRPWPLLLKDVDPGHEAADIELPLDGRKVVSLRVGAEIPGTGCVIEKLRRRRNYSGSGKDRKLVNASELTFRNQRTGEVFQAAPNTTVLSTDSSAHLRIAGSPILWTATAGSEFRLGTTLLKITSIESKAITLENRLTRESITVPLTPPH